MLNKIFDIDNPVMRFLTDLFDLMILNLITIALCIPVVTAAPAMTALYYMALKMARKEQSYIVGPYFKSFKENFKQSFLIGLIFIAAIMVIAVDINVILNGGGSFPMALRIAIVVVTIVLFMLFLWVLPLQSHFVNTIGQTFKNSILMSLGNFPRTLLMTAIWAVPVAIGLFAYQLWPLLILFGLSGPAYCCAKVYSPVFKRFEPEEETPTDDEHFSMDEHDLDQFARDLDDTFGEDK